MKGRALASIIWYRIRGKEPWLQMVQSLLGGGAEKRRAEEDLKTMSSNRVPAEEKKARRKNPIRITPRQRKKEEKEIRNSK